VHKMYLGAMDRRFYKFVYIPFRGASMGENLLNQTPSRIALLIHKNRLTEV